MHRVRRIYAAVLSVAALGIAALGAFAGPASAATQWQPCLYAALALDCATYDMPLDRTGAVAGTTKVRVVREAALEGPRLGTLFVIAGGPGQTAQVMLALMEESFAGANRYDIVAVDQRGSGTSEPLDCPRIESLSFNWDGGNPATDRPFTDCSVSLGPQRAAYNTAEAVADLDAIRADMGVDNATFFGVSYGSKVALAYAKAHPDHTKGLILDSVLPTDMPGAFDVDGLAALRGAMKTICQRGRCKGVGGVPTSNLKKLASRLDRNPIPSFLVTPGGKIQESKIDASALYDIVLQADFNLFIYNQIPGMASSALRGNTAQLERLYAIVNTAVASESSRAEARRVARRQKVRAAASPTIKPGDRVVGRDAESLAMFSYTMFFATTCADFDPPWTRGADVTNRQPAIDAAANAIPAAKFEPFSRETARDNSTSAYCRGWQQSATAPAIAQGPLPNVPTLALDGALDLRTPVSWAERAIAGNPSAQLVKIPNTGHSVVGSDVSGCALSLAKRFLVYGATDGKCKETSPPLPIAPKVPTTINGVQSFSGRCRGITGSSCKRAKKTLTAGYIAMRDALDQSLIGGTDFGPGLLGGDWEIEYDITDELALIPYGLRMSGLTSVPGAFVSGSLDLTGLPRIDADARFGPYRVEISGRVAYDRAGDSLTINGRRGGTSVKITIKPRSSSSAKVAPNRKTMKLRRNYALAANPPSRVLPR